MTNRSPIPDPSEAGAASTPSADAFRLLVETVEEVALAVLDLAGRIAGWSPGAARLTGYAAGEVAGRSYAFLCGDTDPTGAALPADVQAAARCGRLEVVRSLRRKGDPMFRAAIIVMLLHDEGSPVGYGVSIRDLTTERWADAEFRAAAERARLAEQLAGLGVWDLHVATRRAVWDDQMFALYGLRRINPVPYSLWRDAVHPDDLPTVETALQRVISDAVRVEYDFRIRPGGEVRHLRGACGPVLNAQGAVDRVVGINYDVTDRKRTEMALRAERDRFARLAAVSPGVIHSFCLRPDGTVTFPYASPGIVDIYGIPAEQLERDAAVIRTLTPPADMERIERSVAESAVTLTPWRCDFRVRHPVKGEIWVEGRSSPLREPDGTIVWHGILTDITDRKNAENALRASRTMLQLVLDNIPQGVFWKDRTSRYLGCNRVVARALGFDRPDQIVGRTDFELPSLTADEAAFYIQVDREVMDANEPRYHVIERLTRSNGTTIWLETNKVPMHDSRGQVIGVLGTWEDVTERKRLEAQFLQAQKMEAVGQLAGGVAHDFNNLLTVINGYADLLSADLPASDLRQEAVTAIREAGERAARLTQQLLAFSRKAIVEPRVIDLNDLLDRLGGLLRRLIGEPIQFTTVLAPRLHRVRADPGQLEQVIMNLAVNARDAMPKGGKLTIRTANVELADGGEGESRGVGIRAPSTPLPAGRYVSLTVADTGTGMTEDVIPHIFEPFFTTKGVGAGTGLGLATVYGIITGHGGRVEVDTAPGAGTTFTVLLPAVESPADRSEGATAGTVRGSETILLVEDEDHVRRFTRHALEREGYTVLEAAGGAEALQVAQACPGPVHLLVTDVVMPEMGGRELASRLQARWPGLRVLFVSGYTDDVVFREGVLAPSDAFLQKPFGPRALVAKVRTMLDGSSQ